MAQVGISLLVLGTGCSGVPRSVAETCMEWVHFETPQEQFDQATVVLIGKPAGRDGETPVYGYNAQTHLIDVEKVLKGDPGTAPLRISSMPQTCSGDGAYQDGDPLDKSQRMIIFATDLNGEWFTITPTQGALPLDQGKPLPFQ